MKPDTLKLSRRYGKVFIHCIGFTWFIKYICLSHSRAGKTRSGSVLYAFWHANQLPLTYTHKNEGIFALASKNRDGQIVSNVLHSMGFKTIRGSSSRGGMEALGAMARELRDGNDGAITPDGPRGPAKKPKGGAGMISRIAKVPVVPLAASGTPSFRFKSWDRFMLPLPFARVCIVEGKPLPPMQKGGEEEWNQKLERSLNQAEAIADMESSFAALFWGSLISCLRNLKSFHISLFLSFRQSVKSDEHRGAIPQRTDSPVLIHASTDTSFDDIRQVLETFSVGDVPIYVTAVSSTVEAAFQEEGIEYHFLPFDSPHCVDRFLSALKPRAFILIGNNVRPVLFRKLIRRGVPAMISPDPPGKERTLFGPVLKSYHSKLLSCFTIVSELSEIESFLTVNEVIEGK